MKLILSALLVLSSCYAFAECLPETQNPSVCPISLVHLQSLKKLRDCKGQQIGGMSCLEQLKSGTSAHPAYGFLGLANAGRMTSAERTQAVKDFFAKHRDELLDQVGRAEYETRIRDTRRIPEHEIRSLTRQYREHQVRIRMNPNNAKLKTDFIEFKAKHKDTLSVVSRLYDARRGPNTPSFYEGLDGKGLGPARFDAYRPMMVGNIDVANADWDIVRDMPDKVTGTDGKVYDTRSLAKNQAERVVAELEKQMLLGKDLNAAMDTSTFKGWNYTAAQKKRLAGAMKEVSLRAQLESNRNLNDSILKAAKTVRSETRTGGKRSLGLGRLGLAGGGLMLGGAVGIAQIMMENQASCDRAFPHTDARYNQPHTAGLPDSMRCKVEMPTATSEVPPKVRTWLYGNELDALVILNSSDGGNSPCTYTTRLYNANFCDPSAPTEEPTDDGVQ